MKTYIRNALGLFFIFIIVLIGEASLSILSGCFACKVILNREWQLDLNKCLGTKEDCGRCIQDYEDSPPRDECHPKQRALTIAGNTSEVFVPLEDDVLLLCQFEVEVYCSWNRKDHSVEIVGRYEYYGSNGSKTKDCSIKISNLKDVDFGNWDCASKDEGSRKPLQGSKVKISQVSVKPPSTEMRPHNKTALAGDDVLLTCKFDTEVPCYWLQNGKEVDIKNRTNIFFENSNHFGRRKNCNIQIKQFNDNDVGNWTCSYRGSPDANIHLNTAVLSQMPIQLPRELEIIIKNTTKVETSRMNSTEMEIIIKNATNRNARGYIFISYIEHVDELICSSKNGNPPAALSWEIESKENGWRQLVFENTSQRDGLVFNVQASLNVSLIKRQFKPDINTLRCIARHPALGEKWQEKHVIIYIKCSNQPGGYQIAVIVVVPVVLIVITGLIAAIVWKKKSRCVPNSCTGKNSSKESIHHNYSPVSQNANGEELEKPGGMMDINESDPKSLPSCVRSTTELQ